MCEHPLGFASDTASAPSKHHLCPPTHPPGQERTSLGKLRTELEKAANKLEAERMAWEKKRVCAEGGRHGRGGEGGSR